MAPSRVSDFAEEQKMQLNTFPVQAGLVMNGMDLYPWRFKEQKKP